MLWRYIEQLPYISYLGDKWALKIKIAYRVFLLLKYNVSINHFRIYASLCDGGREGKYLILPLSLFYFNTFFLRERLGIQTWILRWRKALKIMPHTWWVPFTFSSSCTGRILTATYLSDQMYIVTINCKWIDRDHKSSEISLLRGSSATSELILKGVPE